MVADKGRRSHARSPGKFAVAEQLFMDDGKIDFEFLALELMRLGRVDMGTLQLLKKVHTPRRRRLWGASKEEAMAYAPPSPHEARWPCTSESHTPTHTQPDDHRRPMSCPFQSGKFS